MSEGDLVSELWSIDEDGTPFVHRIYKRIPENQSESIQPRLPGAILTGKTDYGAIGYVWVSGHFTWDIQAKKAYVREITGGFENKGGVSSIYNKNSSSSGNGTEKATAIYTCMVDRNLGGPKNCKATVWCDYMGNNNGV